MIQLRSQQDFHALTVCCVDFKKMCMKQTSANQDFYRGLECLQGISEIIAR